MNHRIPLLALCAALAGPARPTAAEPVVPDMRLYVLDCGSATLDDGAAAADTGEHDGKPLDFADPCFLIRHPRGWMLWDAGLAPAQPGGPGIHIHPGPPLEAQLRALGLTPADVAVIAFSHLHFDHVGNAALFPHATWILDRDELAWAEHDPPHVSMVPRLFAAYRTAPTRMIDGDCDVFGDGRVRILKAAGHTPGSAVLWLDLRDPGPVILSGDLYMVHDGPRLHEVPAVNTDRAATLAAFDRVERIARRTHARIVIQHDPATYAALPRPPGFLH
jgi:glyoxylase-like metal-dependent hydrolase (beta-lactamase superfamily II)